MAGFKLRFIVTNKVRNLKFETLVRFCRLKNFSKFHNFLLADFAEIFIDIVVHNLEFDDIHQVMILLFRKINFLQFLFEELNELEIEVEIHHSKSDGFKFFI